MATLQRLRSWSVLLFVFVGLALLAFILGDFLTSGSSLFQQEQQNIIKVNSSVVNYKEYETRIQEMEDIYKMQTGQSNLSEEIRSQIRESVYENIVREILIDEQAEALGIQVTDKEMFDMINGENPSSIVRQMPFFQNENGQFDRTAMMNFLRTINQDDLSLYSADQQAQIAQMKNYWLFWENNIKYSRLEEKINTLLVQATKSNDIDAKAAFDARQRSVDFVYAYKTYASVADSTYKVSKSEAKNYYKANMESFKHDPYRSARYVVVDVLPSADDNDAVQANINKIYKEFSTTEEIASVVNANSEAQYIDAFIANSLYTGDAKEFVENAKVGDLKEPFSGDNLWSAFRIVDQVKYADSVKVSQIFVRGTSKEEEKLVDSLLNVLKTDKKADFAALATQFSQDQTAENGGDMGWFRELDAYQGIGADFAKACFTAKKGEFQKVKSKYGLHIIEVTDMTKPVDKTKLAQIIMSVTPSSRTYSDVYNKLNRVLAENQTAETFVEAAREAGYPVLLAPTVQKTDNTIGNVPEMRQAVRFVFNGKVGDVSTIFENSKNQFMVVAITDVNDEEYKSFESVQNQIMREIINEKKAKDIIAAYKSADNIASVASENGMRMDTIRLVSFSTRRIAGLGDEPNLLSAVMNAPKNEVSGPVQGKNGIYAFTVISDVVPANEFDAATEKLGLDANDSYRLTYQAFQAVEDQATIEDNRIRFY